jgi:hypothetical protein
MNAQETHDSDQVLAYGMAVADLPEPHVPSMRLMCDECGEPIWMSHEMIAKMTVVLAERPQATISYRCIEHHALDAQDDNDIELVEFGCPLSTCAFIAHDISTMTQHFFAEHRTI